MNDRQLLDLTRIIRNRRATRHFKADSPPTAMLDKLLDTARWAPSGYNLQPTHFVMVTDHTTKQSLREACMGQAQITEAPVVIVFAGDTVAWRHHLEPALQCDLEAGGINEIYAAMLRRMVPLAFSTQPLGLGWLVKAILGPRLSFVRPMPSLPAVHRRYWLAKQVALVAMNFMIIAEAAGLATCPMEGFDPRRVRGVLGIPRSVLPVLVIPVGYAATSSPATKTRLPLQQLLHHERW